MWETCGIWNLSGRAFQEGRRTGMFDELQGQPGVLEVCREMAEHKTGDIDRSLSIRDL